jgi:Trypsin
MFRSARLFKVVLLSIFFTLISCATVAPVPMQYQSIKNLPSYNLSDINDNSPDKYDAMVGLFRPMKKMGNKQHFFCTATVISDRLALTAAHCLIDEDDFMIKDPIIVKLSDNTNKNFRETGVVARSGAINIRADLGIIVGNFKNFNKIRINLHPGGFFNVRGPFIACGFAWGSNPGLCIPFIPKDNYEFKEGGIGRLYPGMSGGPVIDVASGHLVGVNVQVMNSGVAVVPTVGLIGALELDVTE